MTSNKGFNSTNIMCAHPLCGGCILPILPPISLPPTWLNYQNMFGTHSSCSSISWAPLMALTLTQKCKIKVKKVMDFYIFFLRARATRSLAFNLRPIRRPKFPGFIKPKKFFENNFWKDPLSFLKSELKESGNLWRQNGFFQPLFLPIP